MTQQTQQYLTTSTDNNLTIATLTLTNTNPLDYGIYQYQEIAGPLQIKFYNNYAPNTVDSYTILTIGANGGGELWFLSNNSSSSVFGIPSGISGIVSAFGDMYFSLGTDGSEGSFIVGMQISSSTGTVQSGALFAGAGSQRTATAFGSVTMADGIEAQYLYGGSVDTFTITLPENPVDGQMCYIAPPESGTIITTLIIQCTGSQIFAGNYAQSIAFGSAFQPGSNGCILKYYGYSAIWYGIVLPS